VTIPSRHVAAFIQAVLVPAWVWLRLAPTPYYDLILVPRSGDVMIFNPKRKQDSEQDILLYNVIDYVVCYRAAWSPSEWSHTPGWVEEVEQGSHRGTAAKVRCHIAAYGGQMIASSQQQSVQRLDPGHSWKTQRSTTAQWALKAGRNDLGWLRSLR
jgi:hypothetical protein